MDLCLVHDIQLCYNKSEIRAAKRCFEPRGTRLPDARILKPHPRKGTETATVGMFLSNEFAFQNHIPARGRKPQFVQQGFTPSQFQNHIPARGRKLIIRKAIEILQHFKTTSPQGDGNISSFDLNSVVTAKFQNHIPARGRKQPPFFTNQSKPYKFQNHIPARGRHTQGALAPYFFMLF